MFYLPILWSSFFARLIVCALDLQLKTRFADGVMIVTKAL